MEEYWATRTGRWRRAMQGQAGPSLAERLYQVIRNDGDGGQLPAGARLPKGQRWAGGVVRPDGGTSFRPGHSPAMILI